jgi:hypothetical protein
MILNDIVPMRARMTVMSIGQERKIFLIGKNKKLARNEEPSALFTDTPSV